MLFIETKLDDKRILLNLDSVGYFEPHLKDSSKTIVYFRNNVGSINVATLSEDYESLLRKIHDPCKS
ncbi:MAG: hypothetical protein IPM23_06540 [Candidatus Melainabacteria bacterium]|nr:hypothetical protein [Candidatus Melainabacteria bacterium]